MTVQNGCNFSCSGQPWYRLESEHSHQTTIQPYLQTRIVGFYLTIADGIVANHTIVAFPRDDGMNWSRSHTVELNTSHIFAFDVFVEF